jgi:hypothetical protein
LVRDSQSGSGVESGPQNGSQEAPAAPPRAAADPTGRYRDLGPDYDTSRAVTERKIRNHIAQLTAMGYRVTLEPAA